MCRTLLRIIIPAMVLASFIRPAPAAASNCENDSTGLIPLTDLGTNFYQGLQGGLYPGGVNVRPAAHESAGVILGQTVTRLNSAGDPDPEGRIVFVAIGMSNCYLEFNMFRNWADGYPMVNFGIQYVNCAQGGQVAEIIVDSTAAYWDYVDSQLVSNSVTPEQVQVIWFKNANANPSGGFPGQAETYSRQVGTIMHILHDKFPNLKQVYLASRTYGGYASTPLNPEPYAYESGFGIKWLIEAQIAGEDSLNFDPAQGPVRAPWLSWGPYLWADGLNPRSDGLTWACSHFDTLDGTHPNPTGQSVVAQLMVTHFLADSTSLPWFRTQVSAVPETPPPPRLRVSPNPAQTGALITWDGSPAPPEFTIFDVAGRRIRRLIAGGDGARWDLADDGGRRVPNGIYWARPTETGPVRAARIVVQRN